jgi:hypothetical protein
MRQSENSYLSFLPAAVSQSVSQQLALSGRYVYTAVAHAPPHAAAAMTVADDSLMQSFYVWRSREYKLIGTIRILGHEEDRARDKAGGRNCIFCEPQLDILNRYLL